jgi:NADH-ubiquinone oxidoreductase chain 5
MYLAILALPMFGALGAGLLGRKVGVTGAHLITCVAMCTTALLSYVAFYEVGICGSPVSIRLGS